MQPLSTTKKLCNLSGQKNHATSRDNFFFETSWGQEIKKVENQKSRNLENVGNWNKLEIGKSTVIKSRKSQKKKGNQKKSRKLIKEGNLKN